MLLSEPSAQKTREQLVHVIVTAVAVRFFLWLVRDQGVACKQQDGDTRGVLEFHAHHFGGVDHTGEDDGGTREKYLRWTDRWFAAVKRLLGRHGSFFLNVGSRPKDPWVPFEVLGVARRHFALQNVFHWVKSISVLKEDAGTLPRFFYYFEERYPRPAGKEAKGS